MTFTITISSYLKTISPLKIIFFLLWFLSFSIALPHMIIPGKAGAISILIFILWLIDGRINTKLIILRSNKLFLYLSAFILMLTVSMLWSENTSLGLNRLSVFKYYYLLIPVIITSLSKHQSLRLINAFILGCVTHAVFMLLQSHNIIHLPNKIDLYSPYSTYSTFFVFSSFYCFYFFQYYSNHNKLKQITYLSLTLLFIYTLFTNPSRAGQLAFIFSAIVTLILTHKNWKKTIIILSIAATLILLITQSSNKVIHSYNAALDDMAHIKKGVFHGSWGARWGLSLTTIDVIKENPIFGVGIGDTQDERRKIIKQKIKGESQFIAYYTGTHNSYLTILSSAGIICLIFYLLIYVHLYKLPITSPEIKNLSIIFLTILAVTSVADDIIFYKPYNIHFAMMIALFINLSLDKKDINSKLQKV